MPSVNPGPVVTRGITSWSAPIYSGTSDNGKPVVRGNPGDLVKNLNQQLLGPPDGRYVLDSWQWLGDEWIERYVSIGAPPTTTHDMRVVDASGENRGSAQTIKVLGDFTVTGDVLTLDLTQGGPGGGGLPTTGGTMTGDITMKAGGSGGVRVLRASDDLPIGRLGRNGDALLLEADDEIPLQLAAGGATRLTLSPNGQLALAGLASAPASPSAGDIYFDTTLGRLRLYVGGAWRNLELEAGTTTPAGPLTLSDVSVSQITTTGARLSVTIGGAIPSGALMLMQWTADVVNGPWSGSVEPTSAVAGVFSADATGLAAGTTYYCRASIYSEPGGGQAAIVHAVTTLASFATAAATDSAPSYSRMVNEMDAPSDGQAMTWGSWANNPANVAFTGGPGGEPCPAVNAGGALVRGTTVPADVYGGFGGLPALPMEYRDSDPWPIYTPWIVVIEQGVLRSGAGAVTRLNTETNLAIQFERSIFAVYRASLSAWQIIRDRTDLQTWYTATEEWLIANGSVETRAPTSAEGAGIIVRWPTGGNAVHGSLVKGPIGVPLSTWENGIDLSSIVTDIRQVVIASRMRAVPWNPNAPFTPGNVKLVTHVGCDVRVVDPHQWAIPPAVLSRQRSVLTTWDWYTACTLRDTIRQDRQDGGASVEAGFTKAGALATPIPGWVA